MLKLLGTFAIVMLVGISGSTSAPSPANPVQMEAAFDDGLISLTFAPKDGGEKLEVTVKRVTAQPLYLKLNRGETTFKFGTRSVTILTPGPMEIDLSQKDSRSFTVRQAGNTRIVTGAITWTKLPKDKR